MWLASYAAMLAKEFKWPLRFILWELPLPIGLQMQMALLHGKRVWTVPIEAPGAEVTDDDFNIPGT